MYQDKLFEIRVYQSSPEAFAKLVIAPAAIVGESGHLRAS